jgi:outer membrane lipoprotein-sorting protein
MRLIVVSLLLLAFLACGRNPPTPSPTQTTVKPVTSSRPPFKTKEPERYSAKRVTTSEEYSSGNLTSSHQTTTQIHRSGLQRRDEYESSAGVNMVYIESSSGRFLVVPSLQLYAELNASSNGLPVEGVEDDVTAGLLSSTAVEAEYQPVNDEELNGRRCVKYLVRQNPGSEPEASRDSFIWVDEALAMPIRLESRRADAGKTYRFVTELRDITTQVDEKVFRVPPGYQKIEHQQLLQRIAQAAH